VDNVAFSAEEKWLESETDQSPTSSAEI